MAMRANMEVQLRLPAALHPILLLHGWLERKATGDVAEGRLHSSVPEAGNQSPPPVTDLD